WQPALPHLEGTLAGTLDIQGTYTAFDVDTSTQLQQFGIAGLVAQVRGPIHLHSSFVTAASMAELRQGIEARQLTPQMPQLVLRIPTLSGRVLTAARQESGRAGERESGRLGEREGPDGPKSGHTDAPISTPT